MKNIYHNTNNFSLNKEIVLIKKQLVMNLMINKIFNKIKMFNRKLIQQKMKKFN